MVGLPVADHDLRREVVAGPPDEEGADQVPRRRALGEVVLDVELGAAVDVAVVLMLQPGQELGDFGDLLLGGVGRTAVALSGPGVAAEPVEVVPAGELLERLSDPPVLDGGQRRRR